MKTLDLKEWEKTDKPHKLSPEQRDALKAHIPDLVIEPAPGKSTHYYLRPGSTGGALQIADLSVLIRPKVRIDRLLYLASRAFGAVHFKGAFDFHVEPDLDAAEAMAALLSRAAQHAFARGLLHGYRVREEALTTVRGRIRVADQIRQRFGVPLPVEVRYDEFTDDVLANRLVKTAVYRLARLRLRSPRVRADLGRVAAALGDVRLVEYPERSVPDVRFDRLNEHYREVVALARLVLGSTTVEIRRGKTRASGVLFDMNRVFEDFLRTSLREALDLSRRAFPAGDSLTGKQRLSLDHGENVHLKPDLSWWEGGHCVFVGDAKYKRIGEGTAPNADLYQLLAYTIAADLPGGLLIYAEGEAKERTHIVRHLDKRLTVATVNLSGSIKELNGEVRSLAGTIRRPHAEAQALRAA